MANNIGSNAGLINPATAMHVPAKRNPALLGERCRRKANARLAARMQQEKLVSQKMVGIQINGRETAQNTPAIIAVRVSVKRRATCMMSRIVSKFSVTWMAMMIIAEANV